MVNNMTGGPECFQVRLRGTVPIGLLIKALSYFPYSPAEIFADGLWAILFPWPPPCLEDPVLTLWP